MSHACGHDPADPNCPDCREGMGFNRATFIKEVSTVQTGGGVMVDFLTMTDGSLITLSDECAIWHPAGLGEEHVWECCTEGEKDPCRIMYCPPEAKPEAKPDFPPCPRCGGKWQGTIKVAFYFDLNDGCTFTEASTGPEEEEAKVYCENDHPSSVLPAEVEQALLELLDEATPQF